MKTSEAKEKKFRELSEEELENVNGGIKKIVDFASMCIIRVCPPGCKLDTSLQPCQCVPVPNTVPHRN